MKENKTSYDKSIFDNLKYNNYKKTVNIAFWRF